MIFAHITQLWDEHKGHFCVEIKCTARQRFCNLVACFFVMDHRNNLPAVDSITG